LGKTATLHVGLSRRRTRRESLLLCSYILALKSVETPAGAEDDERDPFSSIDNDEVDRLPFSKSKSPLESVSSIV